MCNEYVCETCNELPYTETDHLTSSSFSRPHTDLPQDSLFIADTTVHS